jgi:hypothetical protein
MVFPLTINFLLTDDPAGVPKLNAMITISLEINNLIIYLINNVFVASDRANSLL